MKKSISIITRSSNDILYNRLNKTLFNDYPKIKLKNTTADGYLLKIFEEVKTDWAINIDEDCLIINERKIYSLLDYMEKNSFDYCGMPDGGVCVHRQHNPITMNPFFNIFNVKKIKEKFNIQKINETIFKKDFEEITKKELMKTNFKYDNFEPFYNFFFWLLEENFKPLFLNAYQHKDSISTVLTDQNNEEFLIHTWYSREFEKNSFHKQRIDKIFEEVLSNKDLKLHLGCGNKKMLDYINIDCNEESNNDIVDDCISLKKLEDKNNMFSEIFMNAVFEHIQKKERISALKRWSELLKKDGIIRINSIPDFERIAKAYLNKEKSFLHSGEFNLSDIYGWIYGPFDTEAQRHKDIFDKEKLIKEFSTIDSLELVEISNVFWGNETIDLNINVILRKK